mmetsp:Transcript_3978/g.5866  ORF Transcript_3978/g.5866 Transcript_3978/m.5866 type:complete len:427 (+) Transcript_3978:481-1761(+)|eukprot:CAMPEP_0117419606 /NCGR_PEP_ID=MMETSP0758-20121206/1129_1 /TAXON_ID=63605 /ORGANISM="Percolomonas cosmopolitus, Strain AE-1 (ATCC 50343)" /LENGTH=426 /DNA_ID=CAMNT_0005200761 /DNA_START=184 /DNA_END=1464 /DNA_ORIENTATION=-
MSAEEVKAIKNKIIAEALADAEEAETQADSEEFVMEPQSEDAVTAFLSEKYLDPTVLWEKYRQSLFTFINRNRKGQGTMGLQVIDEQIAANWDQYPRNLNFMANKVSRYGSEYEETALTLPEQYERFLLNIDIPFSSNTDRSLMTAVRSKLATSLDKYLSEKKLCYEDYELFKEYVPNMSYAAYEHTECPSLKVYKSRVERANGELVELTSRTQGAFKGAIDATANFFDEYEYNWMETGSTLSNFKKKAKVGQATKFSVKFNSQTSMKETRKWTYRKRGWFRRRSSSKTEVRFNSEFFNMEVKADGIQAISVAPVNDWISYSAVENYKSPNYALDKSLNFFGKDGTMPLLPKTYYVVYNPTLLLHMGKEDSRFFREEHRSSFSFGPFNSNKGSTIEVKENKDGTYLVTFKTNNHVPQIIAVDNHVF